MKFLHLFAPTQACFRCLKNTKDRVVASVYTCSGRVNRLSRRLSCITISPSFPSPVPFQFIYTQSNNTLASNEPLPFCRRCSLLTPPKQQLDVSKDNWQLQLQTSSRVRGELTKLECDVEMLETCRSNEIRYWLRKRRNIG
mgnify:CR=1 FL=1